MTRWTLRKRRIQKELSDGMFCFTVLTVASLIAMFGAFFLTNGAAIVHVFFFDTMDTGMDFFNSLAETTGGTPYTKYGTLYPPLANLFFYILQRFIPNLVSVRWAKTHLGVVGMRGTIRDLRVNQAPLLMFLFYIIFVTLFMIAIIEAATKQETKRARAFAVAAFFCYGNLYAIERGNIIILSVALSMVFVTYYTSPNKVLREIALISLAEVLAGWDYELIDCQFHTDHLERMGGRYISYEEYMKHMRKGILFSDIEE